MHDVPVLLVEDDSLDAKTLRRAFAHNKITNPLHVVTDGEDALSFLRHEAPFEDPDAAPRPGLILLDLNLPRLTGREFLGVIKKEPEFQTIPTIVLTTSDERSDVDETYAMGIAGYIKKPLDFAEFVEAIRRVELYWSICTLP